MKKTVITIGSALIILVAIFKVSAQTQTKENPKEMYREESMRKFEISNTAEQLKTGTVWTYNYGGIKVHAYETKDVFNSYVYIIEKDGKALLIETPPVSDNYSELVGYINKLGYKKIDVITSYHPIGATFFETDKLTFKNIYSMKHAVENYKTGPGSQSLPGLKERIGDAMDIQVVEPTAWLNEGENEVSGIKIITKNIDFAFSVEIPEINAVHIHMLGHNRHNLIFSYDFLDAYIALLKNFQAKGYDMYLSSHSEPETIADVSIKIGYLENLKQIANSSANKQEFLKKMNEAYPYFGWPFYLKGTANFLFKD